MLFTRLLVTKECLSTSDDSSAQGRGLSSATTVYLQAPPQTALPKPEHRPNCRSNCRCPVNNTRVVVLENLCLGGNGWDGYQRTPNASRCHSQLGQRTLNASLCHSQLGPLTTHTKTISSPTFCFPSPHSIVTSCDQDAHPLSDVTCNLPV